MILSTGIATPEDAEAAYHLGSLIAKQGWVLLNGGRSVGIMEASAKGARNQGGFTIGILPDDNRSRVSKYIEISILTGMGNARNCINVLTSDIVVACPGGAGTISEIALALKNSKKVILLNFDVRQVFNRYVEQGLLVYAETPEEVIEVVQESGIR